MRQLEMVQEAIEDTIGRSVLGIYLHGSATDGGLKPASDVDVLVVGDRSLNDRERRALVTALLPLSGPGASGRRSVELTVVAQAQLRPWRYPPFADLLYGEWLREEVEATGPPSPAPMPNLAIEIPQLLARGRTLTGPHPSALMDPVPFADTVRGCLDGIPGLLRDLRDDTRNVVLTLARIWVTVATGLILSKEAAASWALAHLPPEHRPVLEHARNLYLACTYAEEAPWAEELQTQVESHVRAVLEEIDRNVGT